MVALFVGKICLLAGTHRLVLEIERLKKRGGQFLKICYL